VTTIVRGVLFDSADVLVRPVGAEPMTAGWRKWFPGPRFGEIVAKWGYSPDLTRLDEALDRGMEYLDERHRFKVTTLAEERAMFSAFYRIVLEAFGLQGIPEELAWELAVARVDDEQMELYEDVATVLERLRSRRVRLGVLSEAWPSLEREYERLGIRPYLDALVVSSREGRLKDDPLLFEVATRRMQIPPAEILFVDDWPPHVRTAVRCGLHGAVLARDGDESVTDLPVLTDLLGVEEMLDG
jgi:putative hydrolase of the HAD superfamily